MYPTKEEILAKPFPLSNKTVKKVLTWKTLQFQGFKEKTTEEKLNALKDLLLSLAPLSRPPKITLGDRYSYSMTQNTIYLDSHKASVISALHELGHHLYGSSELKACRFSVHLFIICFPKAYKKLKWQNHMLIKKQNSPQTATGP